MSNIESTNSKTIDFTKRELEVLEATKAIGAKPVAMSLVESLYTLFCEGYSCLEISKQGKGLSEGDVLALREKFDWDEKRRKYAEDLHTQVHGKLIKNKLETIEYLTNQMSAIHKSSRDKVLKYLMTGKEEDKPEDLGKITSGYKSMVELLQKITGESNTQKVQTKTESTINVNVKTEGSGSQITPELQELLLKKLSKEE